MKVSVCGCGWLGLPLAKQLVLKGYDVFGSKREPYRAEQLNNLGIQGMALALPLCQPDNADTLHRYIEFFNTDVLVINVPPGRGEGAGKSYIAEIQSLSEAAKKYGCRRVIFISTTSVYGDVVGEVKETTAASPNTVSSQAHLEIEHWLQQQWGEELVVLRLSGLIGPGRHPVKFLSGRKGLANGSAPVNLVHLDDCIQVIERIIACWPSQHVLHLSAHSHPSRQEYYTAMALEAGLPLPEFSPAIGCQGKVINAHYTCEVLGVALKYSDLMGHPPELP